MNTLYDLIVLLILSCLLSIGIFSYILLPSKLNIGDIILNKTKSPRNFGDSAALSAISAGRLIHNLQGKFIRSAGCSAILVRKDLDRH